MIRPFFLLSGLIGLSLTACKKDADIAPELRPSEFWVGCTLVNELGESRPFEYRGEQEFQLGSLDFTLGYFSNGERRGNLKDIFAGLSTGFFPAPFYVRLTASSVLTDPFTPPEWTPDELEALLQAGKTFRFGDAAGEAAIGINDFPDGQWSMVTSAPSNPDGYLRIDQVEEYGNPELDVPYFGKKVHLSFSCTVFNPADGTVWALQDGKAVLFFRYYRY